jgi:hypothetical protein
MTTRRSTRAAVMLVTGALLGAALAIPPPAAAQFGSRGADPPGWGSAGGRRNDRGAARTIRRYQEPAYARGYSDGYQHGWNDGRDRDRYDPVGHPDYREANQGFYGGYGPRSAYRTNYRSGFRPGYEDGYRDGQRSRR